MMFCNIVGGVLSPLLANIYLNELDWFIAGKWEQLAEKERTRRRYHKTATSCFIVRYADDFIVMVQGTAELAHRLKAAVAEFLDQQLHLELSADKTLVTPMRYGVDFLGSTSAKVEEGGEEERVL
jgi:RNA-directed DNA polymerase